MTKVLVIEPAGNLWGSERALLDLLDGLVGIEAAVCCPPNRPLQPLLQQRCVPVFPAFVYELHRKTKLHRLKAAFGVLRTCLAWRPDVIYLNQAGVYRTVLPTARLLGLPIVAHVRIFEDIEYLARQSPDPRNLRALIAISHAVEAAMADVPQLRSIERACIYDAYKSSDSTDVSAVRRGTIACIGRVVPVKGLDILVDAMTLLASEDVRPECFIAGDGDENFLADLQARSPASVRWMGFTKDVFPLLQHSSLLVCPSRIEPLGRVVFEAWDAGAVPVVCAHSMGAAEVVSTSGGGLLYADPTPRSLADALKRGFALSDAAHAEMVAKGRAWLTVHCDPKNYGAAISALFQKATSSPTSR